ncbi:hypothetical protein [Nocardioides sp. Kera G14]|uniref:hypothetical protein n=1 Tax=Nocardioides sp. Kera G14 TaxID=2884264 RepID=UPI001D0F9313|nr:hypothetical protein [Nocardioides sp. Kera G14]UDY24815.1 hypothetical protein LH076_05815 [Nocardioides sp. Kera G14]
MRGGRWLAVAMLVVLAGCGARTPTATAPPSTTPSASTATPTPSGSAPSATPAPSITVPSLPTLTDEGLVEGADISWPQCPKGTGIPQRRTMGSPMPRSSATFVLIGLTNGPGFTPNPCLAQQVAWAKERHLLAAAYSVISWPSAAQLAQYGSPFKAGYAQAQFNIATMKAAGLDSPAVWLDVEPVPDFGWPVDVQKNAEVVQGAAKAYADATFQVGVYSTTAMWRNIVGDLRLGVREWRAAGHTSRAEALARCGPERSIQGGTPVLTQWVEDGRDVDVTCPGESAYLPLWFHQF